MNKTLALINENYIFFLNIMSINKKKGYRGLPTSKEIYTSNNNVSFHIWNLKNTYEQNESVFRISLFNHFVSQNVFEVSAFKAWTVCTLWATNFSIHKHLFVNVWSLFYFLFVGVINFDRSQNIHQVHFTLNFKVRKLTHS